MSAPAIFCVLRSGGDFDAHDVAALQAGIDRQLPDAKLHCISDMEVPVFRFKMKYDWPGWWSKMELFRPDIEGDIFYMDLDTVVVGDFYELLQAGLSTMLDDFYSPDRPASGLMYIREQDKAQVWETWIKNPQSHMQRYRGDQDFLGAMDFGRKARRWQRDFPHRVISFKAHMRPNTARMGPHLKEPPSAARIVCFHGKPRPKNVHEPWILKARAVA